MFARLPEPTLVHMNFINQSMIRLWVVFLGLVYWSISLLLLFRPPTPWRWFRGQADRARIPEEHTDGMGANAAGLSINHHSRRTACQDTAALRVACQGDSDVSDLTPV